MTSEITKYTLQSGGRSEAGPGVTLNGVGARVINKWIVIVLTNLFGKMTCNSVNIRSVDANNSSAVTQSVTANVTVISLLRMCEMCDP